MASLFDRIKAALGIKASEEARIEERPVADQPVEAQAIVPPNNDAYYDFLRGSPEPQLQVEATAVQEPVPNHAGELELIKHYAELAKQNMLDSNALNEDLE